MQITARAIGGIGNRLKCILSAMRLADKMKCELFVKWNEVGMDCPYKSLLENKLLIVNKVYGKEYESWRWLVFKNDTPDIYSTEIDEKFSKIPKIRDPETERSNSLSWITDISKMHIDLEYGKVPQNLINIYQEYINKLKYSKSIITNSMKYENLAQDSIGVHVRRGDSMKFSFRNGNVNEKYFNSIDKLDKNEKLFLSTDCHRTQNDFIKRYGRRIKIYPKKSWNRDEAGTQSAFVELLLLSKCKHLIGSNISTFTEMSWWLGGCNKPVIIIE